MRKQIPISHSLIDELSRLRPGCVLVIRAKVNDKLGQDFAILAHDDLEHIIGLAGMQTKKTVMPE